MLTKSASMCRLLLRHGADATLRNNGGNTALHEAAKRGDQEAIRLLLEQEEVDINCRSNTGSTPLMRALSYGGEIPLFIPFLTFLIDQGASLTAKNNDGQDAVAIAEACYRPQPLIAFLTAKRDEEVLRLQSPATKRQKNSKKPPQPNTSATFVPTTFND